jgi:REP element-mobilizing transposase RayT
LARVLLQRVSMAYPVRHFDPNTIYFLSSRTIQSRFLMRPSAKTNELIGGILARAVRQCEVELFAYVFTSNHFHAMVRAPSCLAMSKFMQRLQSNIAIKVGRLVGWRGRFFGRRYSAEPVVDEGAQVGRLVYILSHGVKEGLVSTVREWPGLSCVQSLLDGGSPSRHWWRDWTRRSKMEINEKVNHDRFSDECPGSVESLALTPLPCWAAHSGPERARMVAELVEEIDAAAPNKSRGNAGGIEAQDPRDRPQRSTHAPRPKAHAADRGAWREAVDRYRAFLVHYREAARRWLAGGFDVEFPPHCFRPPSWGVPMRIV